MVQPVRGKDAETSSEGRGGAPLVDIADLAMAATILIWIGNNLIVFDQVRSIDPLAYVAARLGIVSLVLLPWLRWRGIPLRIGRRDLGWLALIGVIGFGAYNGLWTVAVTETSSFATSLLIALSPVFTLLIARLLRIERITGGQWLGVALAVLGIVVFVADKLIGDVPVIGDGLALLSALAWAIYSLISRVMNGRYHALVLTFWGALIGFLSVLPFAARPMLAEPWGDLGRAGWGAILYSSILAMLVGYSLWSWGISRRGVGRTVPYLYLIPIGTGIGSAIAFGENFGVLKVIGAGLALVGLAISRGLSWRHDRKQAARASDESSERLPRSTPVPAPRR